MPGRSRPDPPLSASEVLLFPGVSRPFLIFEPRYRDMIADALEGDRIIGMVVLRPGFEKDYEGRPPTYDVGCAGRIQQYEKLPDGRYVILLQGLTRFRIASEDQRKPYRLARVQEVPELLKNEELGQLSTLRERLTQLLYVVASSRCRTAGPGSGRCRVRQRDGAQPAHVRGRAPGAARTQQRAGARPRARGAARSERRRPSAAPDLRGLEENLDSIHRFRAALDLAGLQIDSLRDSAASVLSTTA